MTYARKENTRATKNETNLYTRLMDSLGDSDTQLTTNITFQPIIITSIFCIILKVARRSIYYKKYCIYSAIFSKQPRSTIFKVLSNDMYLIYLISQNVVSAQLMMFYLARKHCVNYDLEVIYCETASHKLKQKRKSLSFILKRNRDYLSSFVLLL